MVEVKSELLEYQLPGLVNFCHKYPDFRVVAEWIFPTIKEKLWEYRISYLDSRAKQRLQGVIKNSGRRQRCSQL